MRVFSFLRFCFFFCLFLSSFFLSFLLSFFFVFFCFRLRGDDLTHVVNLIVLLSGAGASVAFLSGIRVFLGVGMVVCR